MFSVIISTRSATSLRFLESRRVNNYAEMNFHAPTGHSLEMSASFTVIVAHQRYHHMGHSAHLGTATCPSSKLVPKFEKGDNLMKHVYLAYGGNG